MRTSQPMRALSTLGTSISPSGTWRMERSVRPLRRSESSPVPSLISFLPQRSRAHVPKHLRPRTTRRRVRRPWYVAPTFLHSYDSLAHGGGWSHCPQKPAVVAPPSRHAALPSDAWQCLPSAPAQAFPGRRASRMPRGRRAGTLRRRSSWSGRVLDAARSAAPRISSRPLSSRARRRGRRTSLRKRRSPRKRRRRRRLSPRRRRRRRQPSRRRASGSTWKMILVLSIGATLSSLSVMRIWNLFKEEISLTSNLSAGTRTVKLCTGNAGHSTERFPAVRRGRHTIVDDLTTSLC
ncbi:hypothetical protein DFP72DRAFT_591601 [Ephemerocybe angulata]|uniref:Uncharacterized protein n=1 Tax=Ephemerocybe angulata TaxID=980116 RepID=A0A8H6ICF2_9AGAR|nr:hypothetical protein DFP72DRAFT_591601 [Tulosesus angulatus]